VTNLGKNKENYSEIPKFMNKLECKCLNTIEEMIQGINLQSCKAKFNLEGRISCFNGGRRSSESLMNR
jgi:hypothetical protein